MHAVIIEEHFPSIERALHCVHTQIVHQGLIKGLQIITRRLLHSNSSISVANPFGFFGGISEKGCALGGSIQVAVCPFPPPLPAVKAVLIRLLK